MATNAHYEDGDQVGQLAPTAPTGTTIQSGQACLLGSLPAVALTKATDTVGNGGQCTLKFNGVYDFPVKGETTTNAAIAAGDILYLDGNVLNKDNTNGVRYGYALAAVASGATTTIPVKIGY